MSAVLTVVIVAGVLLVALLVLVVRIVTMPIQSPGIIIRDT